MWTETETGDGDCDDNNDAVYPGAADMVCDGVDNNCDGTADDGYVATATSCGIGECSSTGQTTCVEGVEGDSCQACRGRQLSGGIASGRSL
jgi:hypothetical protein